MNGLGEGSVASRIPNGEPDPLLTGCIEGNAELFRAAAVRELQKDPKYGIGREISKEEYARFPSAQTMKPAAMFDSTDGVMFGNTKVGELSAAPVEIGNHGHWPMRYRSVYLLWGTGIPHTVLPEF